MSSRKLTADVEKNYNLKSPAVKRILREAQEMAEPSEEYSAHPLEDNIFEWHFTIRGPRDSEFEFGIYHGRIILPPEYPMKPPSIIMLTPSGRFEVGTKICLSISSYHPEHWRPSWSIRTALIALISFMSSATPGAIGSVESSVASRQQLARKSLAFACPICGPTIDLIKFSVGSDPSGPNARCVHRLPHAPPSEAEAEMPNDVAVPEPAAPVFEEGANLQIGGDGAVAILENPDIPEVGGVEIEAPPGSHIYGITFGCVAILIAGIVTRRFINFVFDVHYF